MRRLRWSALFMVLTLCSVGWTQTHPSSTQHAAAGPSQEKSQPRPNADFDPGIRLNTTGPGVAMCGSIVSYNFSAGERPKLESVTTCTPSNTVITRRALGKDAKPQGPQLQKTAFSSDKK